MELAHFAGGHPDGACPLLVVAWPDLGKVLGILPQPRLPGREIAVIEEVFTREGDCIDIGKLFLDGDIVPLTIKSLAFLS